MIVSYDIDDLCLMTLLSEADRYELIDREWYQRNLKNSLKSIGFTHFSKTILDKEYNPEKEILMIGDYIERAADRLNHDLKKNEAAYSQVRAFNAYVRWIDKHYKKPRYTDILKNMTDSELSQIRNAGKSVQMVLRMARGLIILERAEGCINDAGTEETKEG